MSKIWLWIRIACTAIRRRIRPFKIAGVDPAVPESDTTGIVIVGVGVSEEEWANIREKFIAMERGGKFPLRWLSDPRIEIIRSDCERGEQ